MNNIVNKIVSERTETIIAEFHSNDNIIVPIGTGKVPITSWKTEDKQNLNLGINWDYYSKNTGLDRVALGFPNTTVYNLVVVDIDTADEAALKLVKSLLEDNNGNIIAYPTRKGAHLFFRIPEEFDGGQWWAGRKTGYVTKTGIGPVDYLLGGLINIGLKSSKTGLIELLIDTERFSTEDINQDMVKIFEETGFKTLPLTVESFKNLNTLPIIAYPLRKPKNNSTPIDDLLFSTGEGRNTESFTNWAGQLNMKTELDDDAITDMEVCLVWMNENLTGKYEFEDLDAVIESVSQYSNEHCYEPYKLNGKAKKERRERKLTKHIEKVADLSGKEVDWSHYFKNIKPSSTVDCADFLIEAMNVRLLKGTTLVFKKGQRDIVDSNIVAAAINETRRGYWTTKVNKAGEEYEAWVSFQIGSKWARSVMETMVGRLQYLINVEGKYEYVADYVTKPLWVDRNGLCIDPFDVLNEQGYVKIQTRAELNIEQDVVPFQLDLDFNNLSNYNQEAYELLYKWIGNGVGYKQDKIDYFFRYFGYTWMIGKKFTRQIGLIGGVTGSGKTTLTEIVSKTIFGAGKAAKANANLFDGKFGLQPVAGKSWAILDEGASAFKGNSEDLKRISGTETTLVEPKGSAAFEAFIPKITVLFNHLPEELDYSDEAVLNRLAIMYLENPLTTDFNDDTQNVLEKFGGEALFLHIVNTYKQATRADITTSYNSALWVSPFQEYLEEHLEVANVSEFWHILTLIKMNRISIEGKNSSAITQEILQLQDFTTEVVEAKAFIKENVRNLYRFLTELGYKQKTSKNLWTKVTGETEHA